MRAAFDKKSWIIGLILAGVIAVVYWPVRQFEFLIYDDTVYVSLNPHVQQGLNWASFCWAFQTTDCSNWHPLTWLTHLLDWQLFQADAGKHHLTNLAFHIANSVLLFAVWRRMTGAVWRSAFVAALFALHPLRVESVAWIAERKDVLSTFFFMLTLWFYAGYAKIRPAKFSAPYWLALFCFILGLMSKPMLVTLPFVLLLLDYWPLNRLTFDFPTAKKLLVEKIPFFILTVAGCIVTVWAQKIGGAVTSLQKLPWGARISNAFLAYIHYLRTFFWPKDLAAPYPHPGYSPVWIVASAAVFLVGVSVLAVVVRKKQRWLMPGWFWFLGMMVPVIGLLQVGAQAYADRYTYVSMIGLTAAIAWGVPALLPNWLFRPQLLGIGAGAILLACFMATKQQVEYLRNTETLFTHALAVTKDNALAHNNLGAYLLEHKRYAEAIEHCEEALRIVPTYPDPHATLAYSYGQSGHNKEAVREYPLALKYDPDNANLHNGYGAALAQERRFAEATEEFGAAARHSSLPEAQANWALACVQSGKFAEAVTHYEDAIKLRPNYASAYSGLGTAYMRQNKFEEAIKNFQQSLQLDPSDLATAVKLGDTYLQAGHPQDAAGIFRELARVQPENFQWHYNLGVSLAQGGQNAKALVEVQEALRLNPNSAEAKAAVAQLTGK